MDDGDGKLSFAEFWNLIKVAKPKEQPEVEPKAE